MINEGAFKLQKVIEKIISFNNGAKLQTVGVKFDWQSPELIEIASISSNSNNDYDFSFVIRVSTYGKKEIWWPILYKGPNNEIINCESDFNGKKLVSLKKQSSLVELANTWAGTIEAKVVSSNVKNALI